MSCVSVQEFVRRDVRVNQDRIILFARDETLRMGESCVNIFIDGTFKIVPPLFTQLVVVLGQRLEILTRTASVI